MDTFMLLDGGSARDLTTSNSREAQLLETPQLTTKILVRYIAIAAIALIAFSLGTIIATAAARAAGTLQLKGKIESFSKEKIEVSDDFNVYVIERKKIGAFEEAKVNQLKLEKGRKVDLSVPFNAVESTRPIKK